MDRLRVSLSLLALAVVLAGCSDPTAIVVVIDGSGARPPISVPADVDQLAIRVQPQNASPVTKAFSLGSPKRSLRESVTVVSGAADEDLVDIFVEGLHGSTKVVQGVLRTRFKSGEIVEETLKANWLNGSICQDQDLDGWGTGPGCQGPDCNDNDRGMIFCKPCRDGRICDPGFECNLNNECVPQCAAGFLAASDGEKIWCLSASPRTGNCCNAFTECGNEGAKVGWAPPGVSRYQPDADIYGEYFLIERAEAGSCTMACLALPESPRTRELTYDPLFGCGVFCSYECGLGQCSKSAENCFAVGTCASFWCYRER